MTRTDRRSLIAIIGMVSVVGVTFGLTSPLLNLLLERQNFSSRAIAINGSMMAIGTIAITPYVARIIRRFGATQFLYSCLGLTAVLFLMLKNWPNYGAWLLIRLVLGCSIAGLFVVSETWINHLATDQNRGRILGLYAACLSIGFGIGPLLINLTGIDGWAPFIAGAALIVIAAAALGLARSRAPEFGSNVTGGLMTFFKANPLAISAGLLYGAIESGLFGLMPVFGVRTGLSEVHAVRMLSAVALGNVLFQVPIGWLADKINPRVVLLICASVGAAGGLALAGLAGTLAIWPVLVIWGGTVTGLYTVALTMLGRQYSGGALAGANAALISAYGVGSLFGPPAMGVAMDMNDPNGLAYALAAMAALYALMVTISLRSLRNP